MLTKCKKLFKQEVNARTPLVMPEGTLMTVPNETYPSSLLQSAYRCFPNVKE